MDMGIHIGLLQSWRVFFLTRPNHKCRLLPFQLLMVAYSVGGSSTTALATISTPLHDQSADWITE